MLSIINKLVMMMMMMMMLMLIIYSFNNKKNCQYAAINGTQYINDDKDK